MWKLTRSSKKNEQVLATLGQALKRPVVTRWNSFFEALQQIFILKEKIINLMDFYNLEVLTDESFR